MKTDATETAVLPTTIRCYDPCLSCSIQKLGNMLVVIEIKNRNGDLLSTIERN